MACDFPYSIQNPTWPLRSKTKFIPVPCGKCPECCMRRSNNWQFRLLQQEKASSSASFVTLTYNTDHVPMSKRGFMTLCKTDFQDFMKRLRYYHPKGAKLRYYAVGEYGSKTFRPHFHAIIFDLDREQLPKAWTLGDIHIGDVSGASVAYTTKYMHKGKMIPVHSNDDRIPEFSLMSKKLGANYLTPQMVAYHQADLTRNYVTLEGGVKVAMPRYYREKIYSEEQRNLQNLHNEKLAKSALADAEESYHRRTGTSDFERADFEARKAKLENFRKRARDGRKSI
ncbi:replication initiation protein [Tortoise microvirus 90]|nr:replication initiation protein [Tortoise microvirus 90]